MKNYLIKHQAPGVYSISILADGLESQILLNSRETIFFQLVLQSMAERLEQKPGAQMTPAWGHSNLN
ncbi:MULTISPECIES: hypothetical protein [unclassified Thiomonas]|jgi:hypothetical protein|uniref:hypothetical protein n=1 Tax=unclassified Thiomonas TaxID=2625466 RepID=UPI000BC4D091|nr:MULTISPECIES: hypothetical protein [unclassified Thiomonas]OZB71363.1 MAG: hypothetical protein B7X30_04690 [Thiomonas sp. 13-64-67]